MLGLFSQDSFFSRLIAVSNSPGRGVLIAVAEDQSHLNEFYLTIIPLGHSVRFSKTFLVVT